MKITIDEEQCKKHNLSPQELFAMLLIKTCDNIPKLMLDMLARELIILIGDGVNKKYAVTQRWDDEMSTVLLDSESKDVKGDDERLTNLAKALMEMFPKGKKEGTTTYWRGNVNDTKLKLKKFFKLYGECPDEKIIDATRRYVESFNGDYRFMRVLKYFICKSDHKMKEDGSYYIEEVSELASYIENDGQDSTTNKDWTVNLV